MLELKGIPASFTEQLKSIRYDHFAVTLNGCMGFAVLTATSQALKVNSLINGSTTNLSTRPPGE